MKSLLAILKHPDELYPLVKLKLAVTIAEKKIPPEPHWAFCYSMLYKVFTGSAFVFQKLDPQLRDPVCILYLILRALDTVEDDTSIATETKLPILMNFHRHIYDPDWHFSCGTDVDHKILIDEFHHISTALLGLEIGYQELIEDMTMQIGAGMAKYVGKGQIETIDDYNEYCHYAGGLVATGLSKMFYVSGKEDMPPDVLSNSFGVFMQKADVIKDYVEDINEMPMPRMFWPREIWSKYADKLEDFKYEENSVRAVQCLNEMVTDALTHVQDCLAYMSALRDPSTLFLCAVLQIVEFATLALCYNNIEVFRGNLKVRRGLIAKVIDQTKTVADVYRAFYEFSCMIKLKVDESDPNASKTKDNLEVILKICRDSGNLNNKKYSIIQSKHQSIVNVHTCSHRARNPRFGTRKSRATLCINWPRKSPFTISNSHSQLLNGELCGTNLCKTQLANLINI